MGQSTFAAAPRGREEKKARSGSRFGTANLFLNNNGDLADKGTENGISTPDAQNVDKEIRGNRK